MKYAIEDIGRILTSTEGLLLFSLGCFIYGVIFYLMLYRIIVPLYDKVNNLRIESIKKNKFLVFIILFLLSSLVLIFNLILFHVTPLEFGGTILLTLVIAYILVFLKKERIKSQVEIQIEKDLSDSETARDYISNIYDDTYQAFYRVSSLTPYLLKKQKFENRLNQLKESTLADENNPYVILQGSTEYNKNFIEDVDKFFNLVYELGYEDFQKSYVSSELKNYRKGLMSERKVENILDKSNSVHFDDLSIACGSGNDELVQLDSLVIANGSIVTIEVKNYYGEYVEFDNSGFLSRMVNGKLKPEKTLDQVSHHNYVLRNIFGDDLPILNLIVFAADETRVQDNSHSLKTLRVIHVSLLDFILRECGKPTEEFKDEIIKKINESKSREREYNRYNISKFLDETVNEINDVDLNTLSSVIEKGIFASKEFLTTYTEATIKEVKNSDMSKEVIEKIVVGLENMYDKYYVEEFTQFIENFAQSSKEFIEKVNELLNNRESSNK